MNARSLLLELDPWLCARCRRMASELPGLRADDVYQEAVEEFLRSLGRWLQQDATVSVIAQARTLMGYCLRHARTRALRERSRWASLSADEDGDDALERVPDPAPASDPFAMAEILAQARGATSPPCALCLLSLRLPAAVVPPDAERAKAWKKGGSQAVPRPIDEAWAIYAEGRVRPEIVADDQVWKDHVGVAWYTEGPPTELSAETRRGAAGKVERYANRGAEDLRLALLGSRSEP